jgi:uncharacterized protein (DUF779 family)
VNFHDPGGITDTSSLPLFYPDHDFPVAITWTIITCDAVWLLKQQGIILLVVAAAPFAVII